MINVRRFNESSVKATSNNVKALFKDKIDMRLLNFIEYKVTEYIDLGYPVEFIIYAESLYGTIEIYNTGNWSNVYDPMSDMLGVDLLNIDDFILEYGGVKTELLYRISFNIFDKEYGGSKDMKDKFGEFLVSIRRFLRDKFNVGEESETIGKCVYDFTQPIK